MNIYLVSEISYFYSPVLDKKFKKDSLIPIKSFKSLNDANKFAKEMSIKKFKTLNQDNSLKKYFPDELSGEKLDFMNKNKIKNLNIPESLIIDFISAFEIDFYSISEIELI